MQKRCIVMLGVRRAAYQRHTRCDDDVCLFAYEELFSKTR